MSSIEAFGIVLSVIPLFIESLRSITSIQFSIRNSVRSSRSWYDGFRARIKEYGLAILIAELWFSEALRVMDKVEHHVFKAEDKEVVAFIKAYTSSFNMIGVAGAIIAQVAITAISLNRLEDSHWTVEAFFVVSLVTGSLSVYFSCAVSPAFNGLHSANDMRDFLSKPIPEEQFAAISNLLTQVEGLAVLSEDHKAEFEALIAKFRWKVPSLYSAIMLVVPMELLNVALSAFLIGLGIYLGKMYTADLIPEFKMGSLGILIIFIVTCVFGIGNYFFAQSSKHLEDIPIERYRRILRREWKRTDGDTQQADGTPDLEAGNRDPAVGHDDDPPVVPVRAHPRRVQFIVPQTVHEIPENPDQSHGNQRDSTGAGIQGTPDYEIELRESVPYRFARSALRRMEDPNSVPGLDASTTSSKNVEVSVEDGGSGSRERSALETALEEFVRVQALNLEATQRLLEALKSSKIPATT